MRRYAEAVPLLKRHLARYPNDIGGHLPLALSYIELGRLDEARAEVAEITRLAPQFTLEVKNGPKMPTGCRAAHTVVAHGNCAGAARSLEIGKRIRERDSDRN